MVQNGIRKIKNFVQGQFEFDPVDDREFLSIFSIVALRCPYLFVLLYVCVLVLSFVYFLLVKVSLLGHLLSTCFPIRGLIDNINNHSLFIHSFC